MNLTKSYGKLQKSGSVFSLSADGQTTAPESITVDNQTVNITDEFSKIPITAINGAKITSDNQLTFTTSSGEFSLNGTGYKMSVKMRSKKHGQKTTAGFDLRFNFGGFHNVQPLFQRHISNAFNRKSMRRFNQKPTIAPHVLFGRYFWAKTLSN